MMNNNLVTRYTNQSPKRYLTSQRISKHQLYILRNDISINRLIEALPSLAAHKTDGILRFLCPVCSNSYTATNQRTNLARCFSCGKNFNTIDLLMQVKQIGFKEAVTILSAKLNCLSRNFPPSTDSAPPSRPQSDLMSVAQIFAAALARTSSSSQLLCAAARDSGVQKKLS
jgi:hypothetical protein